MKAILVEDELLIARVLANHLESLGISVVATATSGTQAIALAREHNPDLIFMDIFLEGELDGIDTYKKILETNPVPVIYTTANNDPFFLKKARSLGYLAFLTKPVDKMSLQSVLTQSLSRKK